MSKSSRVEQLMELLELELKAFATCEIARNAALQVAPSDDLLVHFVLNGEGVLTTAFGTEPLRRGTVVIVPPGMPKTIGGMGPIETVLDARLHCRLDGELMRFAAGPEPQLVLGCAAVKATVGGCIDVFEHLWEPMSEAGPELLGPLLDLIARELAHLKVGSRAFVGALMRSVLLAVLQAQLERDAFRRWLWPAMLHPQLGRAALAILSRPQEAHTIDTLAGIAGLSRSRFTSEFAAAFHRTPMEFLQLVRLLTARRLLASSNMPVKSVAAAVGYTSRSHFTRAFQGKFGTAPAAFRTGQE